jgi:hypothetical protein
MRQNSRRKGVRQGDVLLKPVAAAKVSGDPVAAIDGRFILAEGELSGHNHMVKATAGTSFVSNGIDAYLSTPKGSKLVHEVMEGDDWRQADHNPLRVADGDYEVVQQRRVLPGFEDHKVLRTID